MRILYIEDEPADADLVERYARMTHHDLLVVNSIEAANAALTPTPDLILVDIVIRESKSGYEFAEVMRAKGYNQPMIAVTGLALSQDIERCYLAGFTDILTKPYDIHRLVDIFNKYAV